jgi:DNA-directed RNA polymerase specialized sigma24 family protein
LRGQHDLSDQVRQYEGMVEAHALRFARLPGMENDVDDLMQEGRIAVWFAIRDGHRPSNEVVKNAMRDHCRKERRKGLTGFEELVDEVPALH